MAWYLQATWDYIRQMLPCAVLGAVAFFCLRPLRKKRLAVSGLRSGAGRETALFAFVIFSAGLAALTLFPAGFWVSLSQGYLPQFFLLSSGGFYWTITVFNELFSGGSWRFFMLLGNIVLFMAFGFFPALTGDRPRWWKTLATGFSVSAFIEVAQLFVGRSSDVNDIILNTFGALCGFWAYRLLDRLAPRFVSKFKLQATEVAYGREAGN
ncbi:MAG TPA: VanZ family protein [Pseudoflavonifractor sp.]|nr:VanZ family protein [Pseudoflavonifractor sp.]